MLELTTRSNPMSTYRLVDAGTFKKPMSETCVIAVSTTTQEYYISRGVLRSNREWKTFNGAVRHARMKGLNVLNADKDPMIEYRKNDKRTKIVTNLLSGKLVRIPVNTPLCCDPSSETYWSM